MKLFQETSTLGKNGRNRMSLKEQVQNEMKQAQLAKDQKRLDALRLLLAAIKQREIDERITLTDPQIIEVIGKMIKQRKDSISQYEKAAREDLVNQEKFEIELLQKYLPEQISEVELNQIIKNAIANTNATSAKDIGKVMSAVKPQVQGRADMSAVSSKIKELLG